MWDLIEFGLALIGFLALCFKGVDFLSKKVGPLYGIGILFAGVVGFGYILANLPNRKGSNCKTSTDSN
ncbi:hypothetical protein FDZ73_04105 [bacterium]|nr:MAG: hypothetical protein FDZ73_04105 [bacterium]